VKFKLLYLLLFAFAVYFSFAQNRLSESITRTISVVPSDELYQWNWDHINIAYFHLVDSVIPPMISLDLTTSANNGFCIPIKKEINIISRYGVRRSGFHFGTDLKCIHGDTIYAVFDGKVRLARAYRGYGKMVGIRHYNGLETIYGHLTTMLVKINQEVKAGTPIGLAGSTGRATCTHLHFETRLLGRPFDSQRMIDFEKKQLIANVIQFDKKKKQFDFKMHVREALPEPMNVLVPISSVPVSEN
jgi:murein DD-endopeptidase MepM/ murein hydrolase activator NlpD